MSIDEVLQQMTNHMWSRGYGWQNACTVKDCVLCRHERAHRQETMENDPGGWKTMTRKPWEYGPRTRHYWVP